MRLVRAWPLLSDSRCATWNSMPRVKPSILIIDADAYLAGLYGRKFEADGWKVQIAEHIDDAKKMISRKRPSILLVEPDQDPDTTEEMIRTIGLPTVILTTISERAEIERMKKAGAAAYLLKGHFVPAEVVAKVRNLIY